MVLRRHGNWINRGVLGSVWCSYFQEILEVCLFPVYFRLDVYVVIAIRWNRLQNSLREIHHFLSFFVSINSFSFLKLDILLIKYRYNMAYKICDMNLNLWAKPIFGFYLLLFVKIR